MTYTPLHGGEFVRQVMSPIDLSTLLLLYHSGWAVDRILRICVQEFNDVPNASGASGPTPDQAPIYEDFLTAMRQLLEICQNLIEKHIADNILRPLQETIAIK